MICRAKLPIRWMEAPLEGEPVGYRQSGDCRTLRDCSPSQHGMAALAVRQTLSDCGRPNGIITRCLSDKGREPCGGRCAGGAGHWAGRTTDMRRRQWGAGSRRGQALAQASAPPRLENSTRAYLSYGLLETIHALWPAGACQHDDCGACVRDTLRRAVCVLTIFSAPLSP